MITDRCMFIITVNIVLLHYPILQTKYDPYILSKEVYSNFPLTI